MAILVALLSVFTFVLAIVFMRGTILDISRPKDNPWPIFWYIQLLLVLMPTIVITIVGVEGIRALSPNVLIGAVAGTEDDVAFTVIGTLLLYVLFLAFFLRVARLRRLPDELPLIQGRERFLSRTAWTLAIVGISVLATFSFLGFRHAFIFSLLGYGGLLDIRLANVYKTAFPGQIIPVLFWLAYFLSLFAGFLFRLGKRRRGLFFLVLSLFIGSAPGDKAPVLYSILIWLLAARIQMPRSLFSSRSALTAISGLASILAMIYILFRRQYPVADLPDFFLYLLTRVGVGQMNGVYSTIGLALTDSLPPGAYYWALIPGASFFNKEYVNYQKVLMMVTGGYAFDEMGVVNSYFISEAFAMGGYTLMYLSPLIVAFSTVVGIYVLKKLLAWLIWRPLAPQLSLVLFLMTHDITGGFNGFPLFKGLLVLIVLLFVTLWPMKVLGRISASTPVTQGVER